LKDYRFKTGENANIIMKPEYWNEAKARATGKLENEMDFFASIFEGPSSQQGVTSSRSVPGPISESAFRYRSGGSGGAPPPYTL
jgi:hypothetical protein